MAFALAAVFLVGGGIAAACIPWAGKLELDNAAHGDQDGDGFDEPQEGDERSGFVFGADESDIDQDGNDLDDGTATDNEGDRGNNQGMVWCSTDDRRFFQQYQAARVHPSGDATKDIWLTVDDNNTKSTVDNLNNPDTTGGCESDLYLPEDDYSITYQEDSFVNTDGSSYNGEYHDFARDTYADDGTSATNASEDEVADTHCMDTDTNASDDASQGAEELYWNTQANAANQLIEDEGNNDEFDGGDPEEQSGTARFPHPDDESSIGEKRDVIDEGPHSVKIDFDNFTYNTTQSDAGGLCITSHAHFEHDNNDVDDGEKDNIQIEYGNAIPVNVLSSV